MLCFTAAAGACASSFCVALIAAPRPTIAHITIMSCYFARLRVCPGKICANASKAVGRLRDFAKAVQKPSRRHNVNCTPRSARISRRRRSHQSGVGESETRPRVFPSPVMFFSRLVCVCKKGPHPAPALGVVAKTPWAWAPRSPARRRVRVDRPAGRPFWSCFRLPPCPSFFTDIHGYVHMYNDTENHPTHEEWWATLRVDYCVSLYYYTSAGFAWLLHGAETLLLAGHRKRPSQKCIRVSTGCIWMQAPVAGAGRADWSLCLFSAKNS